MPYQNPFGLAQPDEQNQPAAGHFGPANPIGQDEPFVSTTAMPVGSTGADPFGATVTTSTANPFASASTETIGITVNRPPVLILAACVGLALVAALGAWLSGAVLVAFLCWALAGPVAMGLLALFQNQDAIAQSRGVYARQSWVTPAFYAGVVVCLMAVCVCAFRIAMWAGRL